MVSGLAAAACGGNYCTWALPHACAPAAYACSFGGGRMGVPTQPDMSRADDPHDLDRFLRAQECDYEQARAEIVGGRKRTHWMWYVFPQFDGLSHSARSKHFAIKSIEEATAYLAHPVLGSRLLECAEAAVALNARSALEVFGSPDDLKLWSCATLFASLLPPGSAFHRVLAKYYDATPDPKTLKLLGA